MSIYSVTINLNVQDERELHSAAVVRALEENHTEDSARELLSYEDGSPNVFNCLVMLLDPGQLAGCSILNSNADGVND